MTGRSRNVKLLTKIGIAHAIKQTRRDTCGRSEDFGNQTVRIRQQRPARRAFARELKEKRIFLLNLMSSPGSGKTTTLTRTIERLRDEFKIGVMEADIDSDVDARTIAATGVKSIHAAHGRYVPSGRGYDAPGPGRPCSGRVELAVLEKTWAIWYVRRSSNTGAVKNAAILSVPEGDDKRSSTR